MMETRRTPPAEEPADSLLLAMREQGHDPAITALNGQTGYIEARCSRCNARGWGWYFALGGIRRDDMEGKGITQRCAQ